MEPFPRRPGPLAVVLRTVAASLYLVTATLVFAVLAIVFGGFGPRGRWVFRCARWWSLGWLAAAGVEVTAEVAAPIRRNVVFMVNHQGIFDIPVLLATLPVEARFMAKAELFRIPIFGRSLRVGGFIPVARGDRSKARESFQAAIDRLEEGASVLLFPEETRSRDGRLLPFKRGGFVLALRSRTPIVPVGVRGTLPIQRKGSFVVRPGPVRVAYGEPVEPPADASGHRDAGALATRIRARIAELAGVPAPDEPPDGKVAASEDTTR